jgi:hypothetical protein
LVVIAQVDAVHCHSWLNQRGVQDRYVSGSTAIISMCMCSVK